MIVRERQREREREAETQAEGEAGSMHREPDVGLDPRINVGLNPGTPGSHPGPKAGAKTTGPPRDPRPYKLFKVCFAGTFCKEFWTEFLLASQEQRPSQILAPQLLPIISIDLGYFVSSQGLPRFLRVLSLKK